jgi:cytoskeletal protein RodZ
MRGLGGLSLVVLALLSGLIWAVGWGPLRGYSLIQQTSNTVQPATPAPEPTSQTLPPPKVQRASSAPAESKASIPAESDAATSERALASAVPPPAPPPPKFPTAADVPIGTLGSFVLDSFGPPGARTLGVDDGARIEIFVYNRNRPDTTTVIRVRNGRVVSAVTTAY